MTDPMAEIRSHEAAHAYLSWRLYGMEPHVLRVAADRGGGFEYRRRDRDLDPATAALAGLHIALAGDEATAIVRRGREVRLRPSGDDRAARDYARRLAGLTGEDDVAIRERERGVVRRYVSTWWPAIERLAETLRVNDDNLVGADLEAALAAAARGQTWQRVRLAELPRPTPSRLPPAVTQGTEWTPDISVYADPEGMRSFSQMVDRLRGPLDWRGRMDLLALAARRAPKRTRRAPKRTRVVPQILIAPPRRPRS